MTPRLIHAHYRGEISRNPEPKSMRRARRLRRFRRWLQSREVRITALAILAMLVLLVTAFAGEPSLPEPGFDLFPWHLVRLDLILPGLALLLLSMWGMEYLQKHGPPPEETDEEREGRVTPGYQRRAFPRKDH